MHTSTSTPNTRMRPYTLKYSPQTHMYHTHTHAYTYTHTHASIHTYAYTVHTHHIYTHVHKRIHSNLNVHTHLHVLTHTHTLARAHTNTHSLFKRAYYFKLAVASYFSSSLNKSSTTMANFLNDEVILHGFLQRLFWN